MVIWAAVLLSSAPAGAHTGFESSDPSDGAAASTPVDEITLRFTGEAEPSGEGFQVLDPSGARRQPDQVTSRDGMSWVLSFDEPLAGGTVGVRWMVQAPDAHPIDGAFSFVAPGGAADAGEEAAVEDFLAGGGGASTGSGEQVAAIGRIVGIGGTLLAIGALLFATVVLRGGPGDLRHVLFWVRRAAAIVVAGAVIRLLGRVLIDNVGDWSAVLDLSAVVSTIGSTTGLAIVLRFLGGVAILAGCRVQLARSSPAVDPVERVRRLVTVGAGSIDPDAAGTASASGDVRWAPGWSGAACLAGVVALLAGYLFDGHTVTEGSRVATATADVVHVFAAAVWVGGLAMLVSVLGRRHRRGEDLRALHLAARFSVVAAASLVAVAASGSILAVIVLDAPSELWSTPWGRLLVAKSGFVAIAASLGAYNHQVLIPALEASAEETSLSDRLRRVVAIEASVLGAVVVTTAFLVGAAS